MSGGSEQGRLRLTLCPPPNSHELRAKVRLGGRIGDYIGSCGRIKGYTTNLVQASRGILALELSLGGSRGLRG